MKKSKWKIEDGLGRICPKCNTQCVVIKRIAPPVKKNYFFTQWDLCKKCSAVYFDEKYKSQDWQEDERQASFFSSLRKEKNG